jgi:hypothetical protein
VALDVALVEDVEGFVAVFFAVGGGPVGPGGAVDGGEGGREGEEGDLWGGGGEDVVGEAWVEEGGMEGGEGGGEEGEEGEEVEHCCEGGWGRELVMGRSWGEEWLDGGEAAGVCGGLYKMGFCAGNRSCGGGVAGIGLLVVRSYGWRRAKW